MSNFRKAGNFVIRHHEFFIGLGLGLAVPAIRAKVGQVQLPIKVEASANIDTAS